MEYGVPYSTFRRVRPPIDGTADSVAPVRLGAWNLGLIWRENTARFKALCWGPPSTGRSGALVLAAGGMVCVATAARAQPILIDFEDVPGMSNAPLSPIPPASRLSDHYLAADGVRFSSGSAFVAVVIHGPGTPSGTQIIGGSDPQGRLTYSSNNPIVAEFFDPTGADPWEVSAVSVRGDLIPIPGTKTLEAFDLSGAMIGSQTRQDSDPAPLAISIAGIHRIRMYSSSATVGFDDLRFDPPRPPPNACPCDWNRADGLDSQDFFDFLEAFFNGDADFNGVDGTDSQDYFDFIECFFTGCP